MVKLNNGNRKFDIRAISNFPNNLGYRASLPDGVNETYLRDEAKVAQIGRTYFPGKRHDGAWVAMTQNNYACAGEVLRQAMAEL